MAINKTVRFYIRNKKAKAQQPIYLSYYFDKSSRLFYPIGLKILPKHWDNKLDRVKNVALPLLTVDNKHAHEMVVLQQATNENVNLYLTNLCIVVDKALSDAIAINTPASKELLEKALNNYLHPPKTLLEPEKIKFFPFLQKYIDDLKSGQRMIKGNKIADPKTVQRYKTAKKSLLEFEKKSGSSLTFEAWNDELYNEYIRFLTFVKKYKINNIGFYQKQLLIYLKAARKEKLLVADWLDEKTILSEDPDDIYWTKKELHHMEHYDLSDDERLDRIRDVTLVGCNTGFRISDWPQIHSENFKTTEEGNRYIEIFPDKESATPPSAPLLPIVERILLKYNGILPVISDQKYNEHLKELCKKIGHIQQLKIRYVKEGKTVVETVERWTQATSHTCRRSYATNMFLDGVEPYLIMKATGHTTEKSFKKYLKLNNSAAVNAIADRKLKVTQKIEFDKNSIENEGNVISEKELYIT